MTWQDRIADQAAYTGPNGQRVTFDYEDFVLEVEKRTSAHDSPGRNGTYIQDQGASGRRLPVVAIFHGSDCDLAASGFINLLSQPGVGTLEHPVHGRVDVVPFGRIRRTDALKTRYNQVLVEVEFWETSGIVFSVTQSDPASNILSGLDDYNQAAASAFETGAGLTSVVDQANFKARYERLLSSVQTTLAPLAEFTAETQDEYNTIYQSINRGLDTLIGDPLTLAFQTVKLIQAPARSAASIAAKLSAYGNLAESIFNSAVAITGSKPERATQVQTRALFASAAVAGSALSIVNAGFNSQREAVEAADTLLSQLDALTAWSDQQFDDLANTPVITNGTVYTSTIDTGEAYEPLLAVAALTAGYAVQLAFSLKQERVLVLQRDRTIIDLVGELYGAVDAHLDTFIAANDLTGSEILEIPRGRQIVYYV